MNRLFRPKAMRRCLLFMALIFPVVYLCGGLFFALNGAHSGPVFAQENISNSVYISDDSFIAGRLPSGVYPALNTNSYNEWSVSYFEGSGPFTVVNRSQSFPSSGRMRLYTYGDDNIQVDMIDQIGNPEIYYGGVCTKFALAYFSISSSSTSYIPILASDVVFQTIPDLNKGVSFSDYIFSQPFASNNFISELGKGVINNANAGFAPMNSLFYTINQNVLHFNQNDKLAVFGYGYVYYAVNVLIIYEVLILAVKLVMLPLKAVDVFDNDER